MCRVTESFRTSRILPKDFCAHPPLLRSTGTAGGATSEIASASGADAVATSLIGSLEDVADEDAAGAASGRVDAATSEPISAPLSDLSTGFDSLIG